MLQNSRHAIDVGAMFIKAVGKGIKAIFWDKLTMLPRPGKVRSLAPLLFFKGKGRFKE